ncbi:MAG: class IV adenylate cyclase [Planctomycetia bacterium]|nr:class IV adenylate cyclase [Planctomycetia bacterium]
MYEVELKFPIADARPALARLSALGASAAHSVEQADCYFNHPSRDFGQTDEALRIRSIGDRHLVTYKGPVIDVQTKTRREIEIPLDGSDARDKLAEILAQLGFRAVREVRKSRQPYHLHRDGREFEVAHDQVVGLGTFLEIETLASESERPAAISAIQKLAADLGLSAPERKSYLCLLLEKTGKNS